jgi:hypothetical protein
MCGKLGLLCSVKTTRQLRTLELVGTQRVHMSDNVNVRSDNANLLGLSLWTKSDCKLLWAHVCAIPFHMLSNLES